MSADAVEVRAADRDDAASIGRIHIETWQGTYAHVFPEEGLRGLTEALDQRVRFWRDTIESSQQNTVVLVACDEGRIVGFAHGGPSRDAGADRAREAELYANLCPP